MGTLLNSFTGRPVLLTNFLDRLAENPLNITLSLGIIFALLILIIQLIYVISSASSRKRKSEDGQKSTKGTYVDNVITQIVQREEKELMDDRELVAVITAAIAAYMGNEVPADGLVVRSIRKIDSRRR